MKEPSPNAQLVMERHWLFKDENHNVIETPDEAKIRICTCVAGAEKNKKLRDEWFVKFYELMNDVLFFPNTPTWTGAGRPDGQLAACFVLPIGDSIEEIYEAIKYTALIHKSGGGTGFNFGKLREADSLVGSSNGMASGPVSFMRVFDASTEAIKQGSTRRGANMGILPINHPDIMEFITCKKEEGAFSNFNISVGVTDEFLKALNAGAKEFPLISPSSGTPVGTIVPAEVWDLIVRSSWENGEPGVIFIDRINAFNPTPGLGSIESTNPCGEVPLLPYEACVLGSINIVNHLVEQADGEIIVNWNKLESTTRTAVRFLDDIIDVSHYPLPQIDTMVKSTRKIGLGVMGVADAFVKMRVAYASEEGVSLAEKLMLFINSTAFTASCELAEEKGAFPAVDKSIWADAKQKPRNATRTTIAPTGTVSRGADCSSGIEPHFGLTYQKHLYGGQTMTVINDDLVKVLAKLGLDRDEILMNRIKKQGTLQGITEVPVDIRKVFETGTEISGEWHMRMQVAFQKHVNNAVSKTVSMPFDATVEDVKAIFQAAHRDGLKGFTVYRTGSRDKEVMTLGIKSTDVTEVTDVNEMPQDGLGSLMSRDGSSSQVSVKQYNQIRARGKCLDAKIYKIKTGCGNLYVTISFDEFGPAEMFLNMGDSGGCVNAWAQALGKSVSLFMRGGFDARDLIPKWKNIRCPEGTFAEEGKIHSCPCAIALAMEQILGTNGTVHRSVRSRCSCGGMYVAENGCATCDNCGQELCG